MRVELRRHVRTWAPSKAAIAIWTEAALGARASGREIAVSVVGPAASRKLNAQYRGRNHATNVLSFPAAPMPGAPLGDLVICPQVLRAEAQEQRKSLRAHWAHLVVHGALHLVGYDHERDDDARRMERREIAVLRRLGFPNPYRTDTVPEPVGLSVAARASRQKSRLLPARAKARSEKAPQATFSNESGSR